MMRANIIILLMLVTLSGRMMGQCDLCDNSARYFNAELNSSKLGKDELLKDFQKYDFGGIWLERNSARIGFIGAGYQRLFIEFMSLERDKSSLNKYIVQGRSRVKDNVCDFVGEIEIMHIKLEDEENRKERYECMMKAGAEEDAGRYKNKRYVILAKYKLKEKDSQKGAGEFVGVLKSGFYMEGDSVRYNDIDMAFSDSYCNNQFVGIWKSYANGKCKVCNWGEYRIPNAGDLDIGAGEFSPNKKYYSRGWGKI